MRVSGFLNTLHPHKKTPKGHKAEDEIEAAKLALHKDCLEGSWYLLTTYNCTYSLIALLIIHLKGLIGVMPIISRVVRPFLSGS